MNHAVRNLERVASCALFLLLSLGTSAAETPAAHPMATAERPGLSQSILPVLDRTICDDTICVSLTKVSESIHKQLDGKVVGYAFFVGNALSGAKSLFGAYGQARTNANPPAMPFKATTKMQIASTSKVLTALTALRVLSSNINKPAVTYFPPSWALPANSIVKQITSRQFVSQTSGVMQYYASASGQSYASLQAFFTQNIAHPNAPFYCPGPPNNKVSPPVPYVLPNPIISSTQPCYSDANFGIMRVVLPRAGGSNSSDPQQLADAYVTQVQSNVFSPVGVSNVACKPPADGQYSLLYKYPGTAPGSDWKDLTLSCGDWGWYVSVQDYASVLVSLNAGDGKILGNCELAGMVANPPNHPVGWDIKADNQGHRWLEKNGADGTGAGDLQTTSVGIYGGKDGCVVKGKGTAPVPGVPAALFINSTINGASYGADTVLINALQAATTPKP